MDALIQKVEAEIQKLDWNLSGSSAKIAMNHLLNHWKDLSTEDLKDAVLGDIQDVVDALLNLRDSVS